MTCHLVDLSTYLENGLASEPPARMPKITYRGHRNPTDRVPAASSGLQLLCRAFG